MQTLCTRWLRLKAWIWMDWHDSSQAIMQMGISWLKFVGSRRMSALMDSFSDSI